MSNFNLYYFDSDSDKDLQKNDYKNPISDTAVHRRYANFMSTEAEDLSVRITHDWKYNDSNRNLKPVRR